ncbi:MAG: conjugal transfer protein TraX, partial [Peptococcaceae bacterium]|nr:conjugal transfer protein TraX [Peptococcaceae bacterium]
LFVPRQGFALLALIPIWLYRGKKGYHSKWLQYFNYAFYPVHLLILGLIKVL